MLGIRPNDPLSDTPENRLFWRVGQTMPPRLLLLDAPDVDSDVAVNWRRATAIRQAADVLVAVLTQQKVQRCRREAFLPRGGRGRQSRSSSCSTNANWRPIASTGRAGWQRFASIPGRGRSWSTWFPTIAAPPKSWGCRFMRWTPVSPLALWAREQGYDSPRPLGEGQGVRASRVASQALEPRLANSPHPNPLPARVGTKNADSFSWGEGTRADLRDDLAALHFDAIKIRTFRGALRRVLDPQHGLPPYLGFDPGRGRRVFDGGGRAVGDGNGPGWLARRCRPACWSTKSATGGTPRGRTGRGGFTAFIGPSAAAQLGRCGPPGMPWPDRHPIRWPRFNNGNGRQSSMAVEKLLDELDRLARWATTRCGRD